jgi:hypothetical protein
MLGCLGCVGEVTGRFHYDLGTDGSPIQLAGIPLGEYLEALSTDGYGIGLELDVFVKTA